MERTKSLTKDFFKQAFGIMIVYDISQRKTFELDYYKTHIDNNSEKNAKVFLVGNKSDLQAQRQVSTEEGRVLAQSNGWVFMEVSAKSGENVEECINQWLGQVVDGFAEENPYRREEMRGAVEMKVQEQKGKSGGCGC